MGYCSKCGNKLEDSVNFCPSCGNNIINNIEQIKNRVYAEEKAKLEAKKDVVKETIKESAAAIVGAKKYIFESYFMINHGYYILSGVAIMLFVLMGVSMTGAPTTEDIFAIIIITLVVPYGLKLTFYLFKNK